MEQDKPLQYPSNPLYGNGVFRRRIRLTGSTGKITAELEDCNHGFRSTVLHDGQKVTDIQAETLRLPFSTCSGAIEPIKALIGLPLDTSAATINNTINPRANCTHLYDLTVLAMAHAKHGNNIRQYDMTVDDEKNQQAEAKIFLNHRLVLHWHTSRWQIQKPENLAGNALYKGFASWANKTYSGETQEAAFALQKAYFVAQARLYDLQKLAGEPATNQATMRGACYTYSSPQVENAYRTSHSTRDFTDTPEQLLTFS